MEKPGKNLLLEILVKARTVNALDEAVNESSDYKDALSRQDKAFDGLDKAGLDKEQRSIIDKAISAANECGAAYGAVAYRLGLHDGIRLTAELNEIR